MDSPTFILLHLSPEHRTARYFDEDVLAMAPDAAVLLGPDGYSYDRLTELGDRHKERDLAPHVEDGLCDAAVQLLREYTNQGQHYLGRSGGQLRFTKYFNNVAVDALQDAIEELGGRVIYGDSILRGWWPGAAGDTPYRYAFAEALHRSAERCLGKWKWQVNREVSANELPEIELIDDDKIYGVFPHCSPLSMKRLGVDSARDAMLVELADRAAALPSPRMSRDTDFALHVALKLGLAADVETWLNAKDVSFPTVLEALSTGPLATASLADSESDAGVRLRAFGAFGYLMSPAWAKQTAAELQGIDNAPPTSPAGLWREQYLPIHASLDCPGNRILALDVFDPDSGEVRRLNFDEGYASRLDAKPRRYLEALVHVDSAGLLRGAGDAESADEQRIQTMLSQFVAALPWREL
ncbi:MAG: hypothetical protein AAGF12_17185 [Myxococcota bacterium]